MNSSQSAVYLFAGDSLTEGTFGESYLARVGQALALGQVGLWGQAVNAGRAGDTLLSLLDRIEAAVQEAGPQWVILAVGSNDAWFQWRSSHSLGWAVWLWARRARSGQAPTADLDHFAAGYRALIDRAQGVGGARAIACTVAPLGEDLDSPLNRRVARLNGAIQRVALDCHVPVADVWQAFVDELAVLPHPARYLPRAPWSNSLDVRRLRQSTPDALAQRRGLSLTFDGIHLNSRGADLWAAAILRTLVWVQRE
jgi:lysophospholipase L1-like esterase